MRCMLGTATPAMIQVPRRSLMLVVTVVACGRDATPVASTPGGDLRPTVLVVSSASVAAPPVPPSASAHAVPSATVAPPAPTADSPGVARVEDLAGAALPDGFYAVDGTVAAMSPPCGPCPSPPPCKRGGPRPCPPAPACGPCPNPWMLLEDGGKQAQVRFESSVVAVRVGERLRAVVRKRGPALFFARRALPCPPTECLETEPPIPLEPATPGQVVRRDGDRCFTPMRCAPNARCDPRAEVRVRCP